MHSDVLQWIPLSAITMNSALGNDNEFRSSLSAGAGSERGRDIARGVPARRGRDAPLPPPQLQPPHLHGMSFFCNPSSKNNLFVLGTFHTVESIIWTSRTILAIAGRGDPCNGRGPLSVLTRGGVVQVRQLVHQAPAVPFVNGSNVVNGSNGGRCGSWCPGTCP